MTERGAAISLSHILIWIKHRADYPAGDPNTMRAWTGSRTPASMLPNRETVTAAQSKNGKHVGQVISGVASLYWEGRQTATGERFRFGDLI